MHNGGGINDRRCTSRIITSTALTIILVFSLSFMSSGYHLTLFFSSGSSFLPIPHSFFLSTKTCFFCLFVAVVITVNLRKQSYQQSPRFSNAVTHSSSNNSLFAHIYHSVKNECSNRIGRGGGGGAECRKGDAGEKLKGTETDG